MMVILEGVRQTINLEIYCRHNHKIDNDDDDEEAELVITDASSSLDDFSAEDNNGNIIIRSSPSKTGWLHLVAAGA